MKDANLYNDEVCLLDILDMLAIIGVDDATQAYFQVLSKGQGMPR